MVAKADGEERRPIIRRQVDVFVEETVTGEEEVGAGIAARTEDRHR
jgi:hypothetical protein